MELRRRRFRRAVRLELDVDAPEEVRELLQRELEVSDEDVYLSSAPLDLGGLWSVHALDRPELKDHGFTPVVPPEFCRVGRRPSRRVRRPARGRRARPPSVRVVHGDGRGVHPPGRGRSQGPGDQAHPVPHLGHEPRGPLARTCRRAGQAGGGAGRGEGEGRRAGQHRLGQAAGGGGRPRRLRARRAEDPHEDRARRPGRGGGHPPLLPHRHGELQPDDGTDLRGPRPADRRPRAR